jgi:hypothetical protein
MSLSVPAAGTPNRWQMCCRACTACTVQQPTWYPPAATTPCPWWHALYGAVCCQMFPQCALAAYASGCDWCDCHQLMSKAVPPAAGAIDPALVQP